MATEIMELVWWFVYGLRFVFTHNGSTTEHFLQQLAACFNFEFTSLCFTE